METTDALLFGRRTWQVMAEAWPARAGDPFADRMNEIDKHVASATLTQDDLGWTNSHLLDPADPLGAVRQLLAREGRDVQVMGSLSLVRAVIAADLVDELRLMIEPVLLGGGKRPFPDDGGLRRLELVEATTSATGVQICVYRRSAAGR